MPTPKAKSPCSGDWPCHRCSERQLAHMCHFQTSSDDQSNPSPSSTLSPSLNHLHSKNISHAEEASVSSPEVLGYADGLKHLGWASVQFEATDAGRRSSLNCQLSEEMRAATRALPPRSLTDVLVHTYVEHGNYTYYMLHAQSFLQDYAKWCNTPPSERHAMQPFACLLLEVCALAVQGSVGGALAQHIEYELGDSTATVSHKLHATAMQLSNSLRPGAGGVYKGLQLLLAAAWSKGEGRIAEAWHHVASAVREGQECGMHRPQAPIANSCSEFEIEMRTRLWCSTTLWDWQMSEWLCRPMLVEQKMTDLKTPNLKLDQIEGGTLSPFSNMYHQYALVQELAATFGRLNMPKKCSQIFEIQGVITAWILTLPEELALENPDLTKDLVHPWIVAQRKQLHCFVHMVRFMVTRPLILRLSTDMDSPEQRILRQSAVTDALNCINSALALLRALHPIRTRYHFASFALFDTAAAICSAIIQDRERNLPSRGQLVQAIGFAIVALDGMPATNDSIAGAVKLLRLLSSQMPISAEESIHLPKQSFGRRPDRSNRLNLHEPITGIPSSSSPLPIALTQFDIASVTDNGASEHILTEGDNDPANSVDPYAASDIDLGTFNQIWDYSSLNLPATYDDWLTKD